MEIKRKAFRSKKGMERLSNTVIYVILVAVFRSVVCAAVSLLLQSFRGEPGATTNYFFPKEYTLDNYIKLFTEKTPFNFMQWYGNTLIVSIVVTIFQTIIVLITSYALSRLRFKFRKPLMNLILILGMFPGFMSMTAVYFVLKQLALTKNLAGLMIVYVASSAMQYYICKGFFDTIPKSLDEAARIDGANRHQVFMKIILPLSKPIIIYTILTAFIAPWGEYMFASLLMLGDVDKFNVALGLKEMLHKENVHQYFTRFCAGAVVVSVPITLLFIWLQKYYVEGVTGGAVKG